MLGLLQLSCSSSDKKEMGRDQNAPLKRVTLWRCRSSDWMMSKVWFAPHRMSLFCHLPPSICNQYQGTLHADSCSNRASAWSPVASSSGAHSYLWGTTSWFLKSTSLPMQLEHQCHRNTHKSHGWTGCSCQPSTTSGPPNQDCWRDKQPSIKRMGLGGSRPPKVSQNDLSQSRNRLGSCCSNGSTCLHTVTWIWAKLTKHKI